MGTAVNGAEQRKRKKAPVPEGTGAWAERSFEAPNGATL